MTINEKDLLEEFEAKFEKTSEPDQLTFIATAPHAVYGAYWSFDTDVQSSGKSYTAFKKAIEDSGNTSLYSFDLYGEAGSTPGLIASHTLEEAAKVLVGLNPVYKEEHYEAAQRLQEEHIAALDKFCKASKSGIVGFYSTNKGGKKGTGATITVKGESHPAFCLDAPNFLGVLHNNGYVLRSAKGTVWSPKDALEQAYDFMSQLRKAPSSNAVLVEIAPNN